jgi:hypothetical protein
MAYLATATLFLTFGTLLVIGGVLFAPFLLGAFLLALVSVLARHSEGNSTPRRWNRDRWRAPV